MISFISLFKNEWRFLLILLLSGAVVYANSLQVPFQMDDYWDITNNPYIKNLDHPLGVWRLMSVPTRYLGYLSFALNYHFHGQDVFGYHCVNILIHSANGLCVYWLARIILKCFANQMGASSSRDVWVARCAALLFILHPIQTQAVTYIVQRLASMMTLFYLLTVIFYLKARLSEGREQIRSFIISGIAALCAVFTKENSFTLPLTLMLIEFSCLKKGSISNRLRLKRINRPTVIMLGLFIGAVLLIPFWFLQSDQNVLTYCFPSESHDGEYITSPTYFLTQFPVVATYLRLFLFPVGQTFDYDFPLVYSLLDFRFWGSLLLFGIILGSAVYTRRRQPILLFGILWFIITISVESSFIPLRNVIFEHRMYLPMAGLVISASWALSRLIRRDRFFIGFMVAICVCFSVMTIKRNVIWQDTVRFWEDNHRKAPNKSRPLTNLAGAYIEGKDYEYSYQLLQKSLKLNPLDAKIYYNLSSIFLYQDDLERSMQYVRRANGLNPSEALYWHRMAYLHIQNKEWSSAVRKMEQAFVLLPSEEYALDFAKSILMYVRETGDLTGALKWVGLLDDKGFMVIGSNLRKMIVKRQ